MGGNTSSGFGGGWAVTRPLDLVWVVTTRRLVLETHRLVLETHLLDSVPTTTRWEETRLEETRWEEIWAVLVLNWEHNAMGGAATGGTSNVTYQKTQKREKKKGVEWMSFHHSINFMPNMSTKSMTERLEDYKIINKGGPGSANATTTEGAPTLISSFGTNSSIGLGSGNNTSFGNTNTENKLRRKHQHEFR